jgi:ATP-dependent helicase/nuclease subunit B
MYVLHNHRRQPNNPDISAPAEAILDNAIAHNALDSLILIVPTGRRVRLLKRSVVREVFKRTGKPLSDVHIYTLENFVKLCAQMTMGNRAPRLVSEAMTAALMEEASERARHNLSFFTSGGTRFQAISPSVLERLQSIILGLKEDGITPQSLRADVDARNEHVTDPRRLADIATLYESYEAMLGDGLADYPKLLELVVNEITKSRTTNGLEETWKTLFPSVQMLVLDGFTEFKKPEERFLAALYHASFETRIIVDYSDKNGPLFGGLQDTITNLQGFTGMKVDTNQKPDEISLVPRYTAFTTDLDTDTWLHYKREEHLPKASYVRRWLFNTEEDIRHAGLNEVVSICASENRADEVRGIAKLIRHLALNEGVPLQEICVVMRQPEQYSSLLREMCALYDIPANITDRFPLEKSPVVTAVFAVFDMLLYGFRRTDVNRALQSPYVRFSRKERGKRQAFMLDAANLFTVSGRLRITGGKRFGRDGKSQWLRRMESRLAYLSKREILLNRSQNADADELAETRRFIDEIELAKRDFTALTSLFPNDNAELTPAEFNEFVKADILAKLRVHEQIVEFHNHARNLASEAFNAHDPNAKRMTEFLRLEEEVEKDARALAAFIELLDEMTAILHERDRQFMNAAKAHKRDIPEKYTPSGKRRSIEEYAERLRTAVRNGRYQVREKLGYGVTITSLEQIRGVPFRVTIMCGAVDGEFPMSYVPEIFLGKELLDSEDRFLRRERIQFYQALMNSPTRLEDASKRVFITYPERNDKGDETTRSPFVDALLKITSLVDAGKVYRNGVVTGMKDPHPNLLPEGDGTGEEAEAHSQTSREARKNELTFYKALASEEETVRAAAISITNAETEEVREATLAQYLDALPSESAKQALKRVVGHLDAKRSDSAARGEITVEGANLAKSVYSISALEQYAKCPYQFFAAKSLRLREIQTFDTSLSPMESGSLLHTILYKFYQEQRETARASGDTKIIAPLREGLPDIIPIRLDPAQSEEYRRSLHRIAEEEISAIRFEHPFFELDRESLVGTNPTEPHEYKRSGKLDIWLDSELERVANGWDFLPALAEFAFGELKSTIGNVELAPNLRLHGKIDRVEISLDENGNPHEFLIGDYKSGANVANNRDIQNGVSLQMPLYAAATEELLKSGYGLDVEAAGAAYYILSPKAAREGEDAKTHSFVMLPRDSPLAAGKKGTSEFVGSREEMRAMMDASVQQAALYAEGVSAGKFDVEPHSAMQCEYCSFRAVCRIGELQGSEE